TFPPLLYNVQNLVAGQQATFSVTGAQSTSLLILAYSTTGGGPSNTIFGLAQMSDPIFQIGRYSPDGAGNISLMLNIPPNSVGIPLWTQALEITNYGAGIFSNALALVVQ
ncbi:MAG: hypothetical protein H8E15_00070, partial [Planctomycetes bacterium]|nr:hypothetical protein [Planctomycetota bacterium]